MTSCPLSEPRRYKKASEEEKHDSFKSDRKEKSIIHVMIMSASMVNLKDTSSLCYDDYDD